MWLVFPRTNGSGYGWPVTHTPAPSLVVNEVKQDARMYKIE